MALAEFSMTADEAKQRVLQHLKFIDGLCLRRFPHQGDLATGAQDYILQKLQADDWHRIRTWQGQGDFRTFLAVIVARLLTDFQREQRGHIRKPRALCDRPDPIWDKAWQLLCVKRYDRQEAIETLLQNEDRQRACVEEIVSVVLGMCKPALAATPYIPIDEFDDLPASGPTPLEELKDEEDRELASALLAYVEAGEGATLPAKQRTMIVKLKTYLQLTEEDRLLLRMYAVEGLKMPEIARRLGLSGNPYKRYKRILKHIEEAGRSAGLW
jgi:RNA polymerase sigma factor (sigma-70 family)